MPSVLNIGTYIPSRRLTKEAYSNLRKPGFAAEPAIAGYDEDAVTLAVSAGELALDNFDRNKVRRLFFATVTPPFLERANSSVIASALDLPENITTADITSSLRSSLTAIRLACESAGADETGHSLVVCGDKRRCAPETPEEMSFGDAGAAVLIGSSDDGIAVVEGVYSSYSGFMDFWRMDGENTVNTGEARYSIEYGFQKITIKAIKEFLKIKGLTPADISRLILIAPDGKAHRAVFKKTGFESGAEESEELFLRIGFCGTPAPILLLAYSLSGIMEGQRVLLCGYGSGVDLVLLRGTGRGGEAKNNLDLQISKKKPLKDYTEFLKLKGFMETEKINPFTSIPVLAREDGALLRLHGTKCRGCGTIQYPPRRICWSCSSKDNMESIKLNRKGRVYTYTKDYVYASPFPPTAMAVVDLDGGGRFYCQMTDSDMESIKIGSEIRLCFRRLHEGGGFVHYFWKAMPV
ncbi:MAG TPA: OB-fold domain-containing protein [bacterium]